MASQASSQATTATTSTTQQPAVSQAVQPDMFLYDPLDSGVVHIDSKGNLIGMLPSVPSRGSVSPDPSGEQRQQLDLIGNPFQADQVNDTEGHASTCSEISIDSESTRASAAIDMSQQAIQTSSEDLLHASLPSNFDASAYLFLYWYGEEGEPQANFILQLQSQFHDLVDKEIDPSIEACITLSRAYAADYSSDACSPWFCLIMVGKDDAASILQAHESIIRFLTLAFSNNPWFRVLVRYMISDDICDCSIPPEAKERTPLPMITPPEAEFGIPLEAPPSARVTSAFRPRLRMPMSELTFGVVGNQVDYASIGPDMGASTVLRESPDRNGIHEYDDVVTLMDEEGTEVSEALMRTHDSGEPAASGLTSVHLPTEACTTSVESLSQSAHTTSQASTTAAFSIDYAFVELAPQRAVENFTLPDLFPSDHPRADTWQFRDTITEVEDGEHASQDQ